MRDKGEVVAVEQMSAYLPILRRGKDSCDPKAVTDGIKDTVSSLLLSGIMTVSRWLGARTDFAWSSWRRICGVSDRNAVESGVQGFDPLAF